MENLLNLYNQFNHFGADHNFQLTVVSPGEIVYTMKIMKKHLATPTSAHGGAIAAMMDGVIGVAALSAVASDNKVVSTIEFKISYFKPALLGDTLTGTGTVEYQGKRIIYSSGEIKNQKGEIIAKAMGTLNAYPVDKSDLKDKRI
ncbi:MAG: PaaI family thioesterase [Vicingus serpentipes]|nr:PaaI family thioesterase [Vicingus serpentipes]